MLDSYMKCSFENVNYFYDQKKIAKYLLGERLNILKSVIENVGLP